MSATDEDRLVGNREPTDEEIRVIKKAAVESLTFVLDEMYEIEHESVREALVQAVGRTSLADLFAGRAEILDA